MCNDGVGKEVFQRFRAYDPSFVLPTPRLVSKGEHVGSRWADGRGCACGIGRDDCFFNSLKKGDAFCARVRGMFRGMCRGRGRGRGRGRVRVRVRVRIRNE